MVDYRFNNGRGAVLCRKCRVIIDDNISYEDAVAKWDGKDVCEDCKEPTDNDAEGGAE